MSDAPARRDPAPDQIERDRVVTDLDRTLFVTAGAGSGKTKSLVDRVTALVLDGGVEIGSIAAITFTEKAAAELSDRVRRAFEAVAGDPSLHGEARSAAAVAALRGLDSAAIGTLHAFAQRVLREHPLEAGLPPRVEVLDEIESEVAFEARWSEFARELFERALDDPPLERALLVALARGVSVKNLRSFAVLLGDNWDRVEARGSLSDMVPVDPPPDEATTRRLLDDLGAAVAPLAAAPAGDKLTLRLQEFDRLHRDLVAAVDDPERAEILAALPKYAGNCGNKQNWKGGPDKDVVCARLAEVGAELDRWRESLTASAVDHLLQELGRFTLASVERRRAEGRLEFHDLLVLARQLLTQGDHAADVRRRLHGRYQRLLLDEFQDTDPIQVELAVGIAADPTTAWPDGTSWSELPVAPGRLFFVGDAKQSIYRFRRADIELYLQAQERFDADRVTLSANFRTVAPVLDWVNRVFGDLIVAAPGSQPDFEPLIATRQPPTDAGPSVTVLGGAVHPGKPGADEMRRREAADVAAAVRTALDEGWLVEDDDGASRPARRADISILLPTRASLEPLEDALDAVGVGFRAEASSLVYSTREVRDLLAAARAVDDPTDSLSVVTALRSAAFGCSDRELFDYAVTLGGRWDHQGARLDPAWRPGPDADPNLARNQPLPADHPVVAALRYLRRLHRERVWSSPSEVLDRIIRDRRLFELGVGRGRARDVWRRLRFVADQARAWSESDGGSLREYLAWAARQGDDDRVTESVLPETDDDAVRIMTIHAAKGLEFPITVVSGATTSPASSNESVRVAWTPSRLGYRIAKKVQTPDFDGLVAGDAELDHHERLRLLYVACTRARDHLVVSIHRHEKDAGRSVHLQANGTVLAPAVADADHWELPPAVDPAGSEPGPPDDVSPPGVTAAQVAAWTASVDRWRSDHSAALAAAEATRTWSATALAKEWVQRFSPPERSAPAAVAEPTEPADPAAVDDGAEHHVLGSSADTDPGLDKDPPDLELPPWNKGRYGTAVGRAVHAVLQAVDLASATTVGATVTDDPTAVLPPGHLAAFDAAVATQSAGEGVAHLQDLVRRLAWSGLTSDRVARAVAAPQRWREIYVGAPLDGHPVEGYLDLLYRTDTGYVVVDHKTDSTGSTADRAALLDRYRGQGATYALAVEAITGGTVEACVFLLLDPAGATEVVLEGDDLARTEEEVRSLLAVSR